MSLTIDPVAFGNAAIEPIREFVYQALVKVALSAASPIQDAVQQAILASPEYQSLLAGDLRALFGIEEPQSVLDAIMAGVRNSVIVNAHRGFGDVLASLTVEILRSDMSDVMNVQGAKYVSLSLRRGTFSLVSWLSWLLLEGTSVVVAQWEAKQDRTAFAGTRTGKAVMVLPRKRPGRGFQVPPEFSGVVDNNWLTRCMTEVQSPVYDILVRLMEQAL